MTFLQPLFGGFLHRAVGANRWQTMGETTAEGRLYNRSPRLACLPGASCDGGNLPPKSGCINYLQGGGCGFYNRSSAVVARALASRGRQAGGCGFYNRSSAVDANGLMSRGRQANPVLTYETALRRFFALRRWRKPMAMGGSCEWMVAIRKISKLCANSICSFWEY